MRVRSLGREDLLEKETATHSTILAWRIPMDRRAWRATIHGVTKSWTLTEWQSTAQHILKRHMVISDILLKLDTKGSYTNTLFGSFFHPRCFLLHIKDGMHISSSFSLTDTYSFNV